MVEAIVQEQYITAEAFEALPPDGKRYDLLQGVLIEVCRPTGVHGQIQMAIGSYLYVYLRQNKIGHGTTESGYRLSSDTVLGPDVAFISNERIDHFEQTGMIHAIPDFVVEIVSPEDRQRDIDDKVQSYLAAGTRLIWVIYPRAKTAHVFTPDSEPRPVGIDGTLDGEDVLPGFTLPLRDVFADVL